MLPSFCSSINKPLVVCSKEFYLCAGVFTIFMKNAESAGMGLTGLGESVINKILLWGQQRESGRKCSIIVLIIFNCISI